MQQAACDAQEAATGAYEESNIHGPNPLHIGGGMRQIRQRAARTAARASGAKCCAVGAPEHDSQPDHAL